MATIAQARSSGGGRRYVRYYFAVLSGVLVLLSLVAFADNLFTDVDQPSNSDPKMVVHGLFTGAWMVILFVQAALVSRRNVALHRRLGWWGAAIAAGMVVSTIYLFVAVWKGWAAMDPEVKANRLLMAGFVPAVALGFWHRRRPDLHKRLIFGGTLLLLEPILARDYDPLVAPLVSAALGPAWDPFLQVMFSAWVALFGSLLVYDRLALGRLHPVSLASLGWFMGATAIAYLS